MKRTHLLAAATCAIVVALLAFTAWKISHPEAPRQDLADSLERPPSFKSAISFGEDLNARFDFDVMRMRDLATGEIPRDIYRQEMEFAKRLPMAKLAKAGKQQATVWQRRGPTNVGGRTRALAYDVSDETRILAGGVSGGMWLSTNSGSTWTKTTSSSQLHSVTAIAQDTRAGETDTWYVGTGEVRGNSASESGAFFAGDGVYKSTDGGASWTLLPSTVSGTPQFIDSFFDLVLEVATDPSNAAEDEVYVASALFGSILRSTNGGTSWTMVLGNTSSGPRYADVAVTTSGTVFAAFSSDGSNAGMWKSTTGTSGSWTDITPAGFPSSYQRQEIAIDPSDEDNVWFLAETPGSGTSDHSLWKYDDGAGTWTNMSSLIPALGGTSGNFNSQSSYDLVIKVSPRSSDTLFVGGTNLFRLAVTAATSTWIGGYTHQNNSFARYTNHHPDQHSMAFLPSDPDVMLSGNDGGVMRTDNANEAGNGAVDWTDLNTGYENQQFYTVCFNLDDSDPFVGGGMQDNGTWGTTSTDGTVAWDEELGGDGSHCQVANRTVSGTYRYSSIQNGIIYRQQYGAGGGYQGFRRVDPTGGSGYLFINPFILSPTSPEKMFLAGGSTVWRQDNFNAIATNSSTSTLTTGWTDLDPYQNIPDGGTVSALAMSSASPTDRLYFGTADGNLYRYDNASSVAAQTAPVDLTDAAFPSGYVSDISVDPTNGSKVMVAFSNYNATSLFYSDDAGATWTDIEGNLSGATGPSVRSVALAPGTTTPYLVGTSTGLYSATSLAGASTIWSLESPSLIGNVVVDMVRFRPADNFLFVGTHAHGTFDRDVSLPVEIADLDIQSENGNLVLNWSAFGVGPGSAFEVDYKVSDDASFTTGGRLNGVADQSAYRLALPALLPNEYTFRVRAFGSDGALEVSEEIRYTLGVEGLAQVGEVYPNPSAADARITIAVAESQRVRAEVFDVAGRRLHQVFDETLAANATRVVKVDNRALPAGVYFLRISGEEFSESKRFTIAR